MNDKNKVNKNEKEAKVISLYIYAGLSVPEMLLRQGKVYKEIPKLPKGWEFLKDWFIPVKDYPRFKLEAIKQNKYKQLSKQILEARRKTREVS